MLLFILSKKSRNNIFIMPICLGKTIEEYGLKQQYGCKLHKINDMVKSSLSFEKGSNFVINNVFGSNTHDEISMSIVFHKLHIHLVYVVKLKLVK